MTSTDGHETCVAACRCGVHRHHTFDQEALETDRVIARGIGVERKDGPGSFGQFLENSPDPLAGGVAEHGIEGHARRHPVVGDGYAAPLDGSERAQDHARAVARLANGVTAERENGL